MKPSTFNLQSFGSSTCKASAAKISANPRPFQSQCKSSNRTGRAADALHPVFEGISVSECASALSFTWATEPHSRIGAPRERGMAPSRLRARTEAPAAISLRAKQPLSADANCTDAATRRWIFVRFEDCPLACPCTQSGSNVNSLWRGHRALLTLSLPA